VDWFLINAWFKSSNVAVLRKKQERLKRKRRERVHFYRLAEAHLLRLRPSASFFFSAESRRRGGPPRQLRPVDQ
jgi:hypothetical protein